MPEPRKITLPPLTGPQVLQLGDALLHAFTPLQMRQLLKILGQDYEALVPRDANYKSALQTVIRTAVRFGWAGELLREARARNPGNAELAEFQRLFPFEPEPSDGAGAERHDSDYQGGL